MLTGLALRRAILETVFEHQKANPEAPLKQEDLGKRLQVDVHRLEAHFVFLERGGYVSFLHMPGPHGERMRFVTVTAAGEKYLKNPRNFEAAKGEESPFKVIEKDADEAIHDEVAPLRAFVEKTEWVLDDEKPEILGKIDELEEVLEAKKFDPAAVSGLKLYFERHRWLAPHVSALIKKRLGF